jgi:hypothetical protein
VDATKNSRADQAWDPALLRARDGRSNQAQHRPTQPGGPHEWVLTDGKVSREANTSLCPLSEHQDVASRAGGCCHRECCNFLKSPCKDLLCALRHPATPQDPMQSDITAVLDGVCLALRIRTCVALHSSSLCGVIQVGGCLCFVSCHSCVALRCLASTAVRGRQKRVTPQRPPRVQLNART